MLLRRHLPLVLVMLITLAVYAFFVLAQFDKHNSYDFGQYLQPGGYYGVPQHLAQHGYQALRYGQPDNTGWDGQFYYYLADDPFLLNPDTARHIDGPQYRGQRIGFALFTYVLARLTGQDWVSPIFYFFVTLGLLAAATFFLARFLQEKGYSPFLVLPWSAGASPLFSLMYGFVDGMADAFVILALLALVKNKRFLFVILLTLAILTRENFILLPACLALVSIIHAMAQGLCARNWKAALPELKGLWMYILPIALEIAWQLRVHQLFGMMPMTGNLIGLPFISTIDFFTNGMLRPYLPFTAHDRLPEYSLKHTVGLGLFLAGLVVTGLGLWRSLRDSMQRMVGAAGAEKTQTTGLLLGLFATYLLYASFGPGMVWAPVGYVKGSSFFIIMLCFSWALLQRRAPAAIPVFLGLMACFYNYVIWTTWM